MADTESRKVKIDVDVSEALTGLKAIQREARDAVKALRELEEAHRKAQDIPIYFPLEEHPIIPRTVSPLTVGVTTTEAPSHVKTYGKSEGWSNKGKPSNGGVWFDKTITDDIRRSYE